MNWDSNRIRQTFLNFFEQKTHKVVPSAPMVIKDDPTLMFTNAGMNQFKDYFLGNQEPEVPRVADTQKCLRVSGKHNDLEEVGVDTYHHTMFEMLGNWSFGDYFKAEAIAWAWELLADVYKLDKDRLYITVFGGDQADGLKEDEEAIRIWEQFIPKDRILHFGKKDNFWEMGDTGPCGPCSEIHVDIRTDEERAKADGRTLVNQDHPEVIEIWNLVFMQYNRKASGELVPLPQKHIDTGMGLERLAMVLQGKRSNYDTDIFQALIGSLQQTSGHTYTATMEKADIANRVIADHIRAIAFSIADGQLPSNTGAGYVIRRILRRAVRYGYSFLSLDRPFLYSLVPVLVDKMGSTFPELVNQQELITKVIREEEEGFLRTLERGIQRFNEYRSRHRQVKGDFAFELYDTYGFPIDLTQLMAAENGMSVDIVGFQKALDEQKARSRKATSVTAGDWVELLEDDTEEFIGYDYTEAEVRITRYRQVEVKGKTRYQLVFSLTPFYPEGGGQVGDKGYIEAEGKKVSIIDTKKENNLIIHITEKLPEDTNAVFRAVVHGQKRALAAKNHTATHLLHQALREVLGDHVEQRGSLVNADHLRFDFSHFQKVESEELRTIERLVNERIQANIELDERRSVPMAEAQEMGAMALFGEKYGDVVRVIRFGDSVELCGGTHVPRTGNIGLFKIVSEGSVAAGIRRIEAISADKAQAHVDERLDTLEEIAGMLKNARNVSKAVSDLIADNARLTTEVEAFKRAQVQALKAEIKGKLEAVNGARFAALQVDLDAGAIKDLAFQLRSELDDLFLVLGATGAKTTLTIAISEKLAQERDWHAGNLVRELAKEIRGGGGGQPFFATAGGSYPEGLPSAFDKARDYISA